MESSISIYRLLLIGDSGVGKSCILSRFCDEVFSSDYSSTVGVDFKIRSIYLNGSPIKLQIWDTAGYNILFYFMAIGQERFRTITSSYYRNSQGIMVVFDVTNQQSFNNISYWYSEIKKYCSEDAQILIIGNKCDLSETRVVDYQQALNYVNQLSLTFLETSAKNNYNVEKCFYSLSSLIKQYRNTHSIPDKKAILDLAEKKKTNGCCDW